LGPAGYTACQSGERTADHIFRGVLKKNIEAVENLFNLLTRYLIKTLRIPVPARTE